MVGGSYIKELRARFGLSQAAFAKLIGLNQAQISIIENRSELAESYKHLVLYGEIMALCNEHQEGRIALVEFLSKLEIIHDRHRQIVAADKGKKLSKFSKKAKL